MVITPSSVDRGACIEQFSQYPSEREFLFVPLSFLQPSEAFDGRFLLPCSRGFVSAYVVRINSNLKSETVEQLLSKKKDMHIAALSSMLDEVQHDLQALASSGDVESRLLRDRTRHQVDLGLGGVSRTGTWSHSEILGCIMKQCNAVLVRQKSLPPSDFVDDFTFRSLVSDLLNTKQFAKEKLQLWLHDDSQLVVFWSGYTLRDSHRLWLSHTRKSLQLAQTQRNPDRIAHSALTLLQVKGRVRTSAEELSTDGEAAFVEAGGDGWQEEDVCALCTNARNA
jgi:hypothetical protein